MRTLLPRNCKGFTLIELLVVIAIIGILAAVAIPQFPNYRRNAYCSRVESDVNNIMAAMEAYYAAHDVYTNVFAALGVSPSQDVTIGINLPPTPADVPSVGGADNKGQCPKGTTFMLEQGAAGEWLP